MNSLISSLIEVNLLLILLFGVYQLIKNKLTFTARRLSLIALPMIAFLGLFINDFFKYSSTGINLPSIQLDLITIGESTETTNTSFTYFELILVIGSFLFILFSIYKIFKILFLFKSAKTDSINY